MITNISQLKKQREYVTNDQRTAALFALYFNGKLTQTSKGNWVVTI